MKNQSPQTRRPIALVILDGWGHAPETESNAIALAHTPNYDEICRLYPMTTLTAAGTGVGQADGHPGGPEVGHLNMGTGRAAQTDVDKVKTSIANGTFFENDVFNRAFAKAKERKSDVHLIGLLSEGGVHSSTESLFAILRLAKTHALENVYIHCILDGVDVTPRTADVYAEALEIKLADIGLGKIATLCGRFFAMDDGERWERTARAFTMMVHSEGERVKEAVPAVRGSFLRGIADEFIAPIVIEKAPDVPVAKIKTDDLVVFFNHRADGIKQLVRSLCVPDESVPGKPVVDTVCLMEYDRTFNLPSAFRPDPEQGTLTDALTNGEVSNFKITEASRFQHLTHFFDGNADSPGPLEHQILVSAHTSDQLPEGQSFKIVDRLQRALEDAPNSVVVANLPAADLMAATGDLDKTVAAIQFIDTCIGGICDTVRQAGGAVIITSTHGNCEEMVHAESGEPSFYPTANLVPFHLVDDQLEGIKLREGGALADVAPTLLGLLGLEKPAEMTGSDLRVL